MSEEFLSSSGDPSAGPVRLLVRITEVSVEEAGTHPVPLAEYRGSEPDPLHLGAAEQLQHLASHHPDAISTLTRLCDREVLIGVVRVLPVALDRYGIVLRVERLRGYDDVRLPFLRRVDTGAEAAEQMRYLLAEGTRRRPCGR